LKVFIVTVDTGSPFGSGYYRVYGKDLVDVKQILAEACITKYLLITDDVGKIRKKFRKFLLEIRRK
jgi:hypothetical protein